MAKVPQCSPVRALSRWPIRLALIVAALVGSGALDAAEAQAPPPAVGVRAAEIRGVARSYEFIGRIKAINTVQLRARVEGFLDKILFTEGQEVKAGDLLYQIEKAHYPGRGRPGQGQSSRPPRRRRSMPSCIQPRVELVKNQFSAAGDGRPGQGDARQRQGQRSCRTRPP